MKTFFDVLLYITFFASILLVTVELIAFPAWVKKIDFTANKSDKPIERYLENKFALLEGRIALTAVLCGAIGIISFLLGSFPKEIENPSFLLFIPLVLMLIGTSLGGVFLGQYFLNTARKSKIYQKTNDLPTIFVHNRFQYAIGLIIGFYLSCIAAFAIMLLLFMLNLI